MDRFAVAVVPIVDVEAWLAFCREAAEDERATRIASSFGVAAWRVTMSFASRRRPAI